MDTIISMVKSIQAFPTSLFLLFLLAIVLASVYATWKVSGMLKTRRWQRHKLSLEDDHLKVQKGLKQIFDTEKKEQMDQVQNLLEEVEKLKQRIDDYRRKVAGLGVFSFLGSKKRSDILYSLLLENEMLEQLLFSQSERIIDQSNQHLKEKIIDIGKRQRLMSEIFNDEKIKGYVEDVLASDIKNIKTRMGSVNEAGKASTSAPAIAGPAGSPAGPSGKAGEKKKKTAVKSGGK